MLVVHVKVLRCFKHVRVVGEMASVSQKLPNIVDMILFFFFFWIIRIYREPFREPFLLGMVRSCAEASLIPIDICIFGEIDFRAGIQVW